MTANKYYVTFGLCHVHKMGDVTFNENTVAVINAPTEQEARDIAFQVFEDKWSFIYTNFEEIAEFNYEQICLN